MNDAAILGRILRDLVDTCIHCGCHGGSCRIGGGELCSWVASEGLLDKTLCNSPACLTKEMYRKKAEEREAKRKQADAERAARIPYWVRARARKTKRRKAKGRVAA